MSASGIIKSLVLIAIVIALTILPLFMQKDAEFGGADGEAEKAIIEINAEYKPWFEPLIEPKSGEIESLLFSLQAAIGSGILFYGLGYMRGRKKQEEAAKQ
ncbi:Cobalt transport protein CbiN [Sporotomaculum syntrophicum]|uniref:Cobalt transport protein CbiN n=1 Tax=Sporotomaculum syntrophicum TaxID=182264 RepID=A0A9D2WN28_9FIRM|nr:energy-coupling factor ABC transporter substrate-binding protein [Sporotomaculum syntrophicum]KAF1084497.1 Cobalt transport protein CbiN [Sporotomaculum syntrophicum]